MAKICFIVGLFLIVGGFALPFINSSGFFQIPGLSSIPGITEPQVSDLCKPGETLKKSSGGSARIPGTNTYNHSIGYECVDAKGYSRDVTGNYLVSLGKEAGGFVKQLAGSIMLTTITSILGFIFIVTGLILAIRNGISSGKMRVYAPVYKDVTGSFVQNSTAPTQSSGVDATSRLKQLEGMYRENLITRTEYDTKKKEILKEI